MHTSRRSFLAGAAATTGLAAIGGGAFAAQTAGGVTLTEADPITARERTARRTQARALMREQGIDAIVLEPGSSMIYFTGVKWWLSERLTAAVIPAEGEMFFVSPTFERPKLLKSLDEERDVTVWEEHEDPFQTLADAMKRHGLNSGRIGMEREVRFFVSNGLRQAMGAADIVSAMPVVNGCRVFKSPAELRLMQRATDITIAAYRSIAPRVEDGMMAGDISAMMTERMSALGGKTPFSGVQIGEGSAYPHGLDTPQSLQEGRVVLMDSGCTVDGYHSDVSRTFVFGEPTSRQREIWNHVRDGQALAFETVRLGVSAGTIDDTVRAYYETLGYGPGYGLPGLSHRTGHGIGLDVHEEINFVSGEETPLAPGMCLSNEPGIYVPGAFGVRIEDCIYMTDSGPQWFSRPPASIDHPFGA